MAVNRLHGVGHWFTGPVVGLTGAIEGLPWWADLIVVVVTTMLSLWVWDVHQKGGLSEWCRKWLALYKESGSVRTAVAKDRSERKRVRLESRLERRRMRRAG
jgi:hypothetical protein